MASDGKDIPLVLVTGAGASRDLGIGNEKIPLMPDWSNHLVTLLNKRGGAYLRMTGLEPNLDGLEFETRLGRYLKARVAFMQTHEIIEASKGFQFAVTALNDPNTLDNWRGNVDLWLTEIDTIIATSLYELFASPRVDVAKAAHAYDDLLGRLGVVHGSRFVFATTNFDPVAELALEQLGYKVQWGETVRAGGGQSPVDVDGLTAGIDAYVPLLHLHGRVGWFRRAEDNHAYATAGATAYNPGFGTPIVMLPNLEKEYGLDNVIDLLWRQLGPVLERAEKVLVLGHGLNDPQLVSVLRDNVRPVHRLAVTVLAHPDDLSKPWKEDDPVFQRVADELSGARIIPIRFGDENSPRSADLVDWLERINAS